MDLRVVFFGSSQFAVPALQMLCDSSHKIAAVYSQPPRRAGRGMAHRPTAVAELAQRLGLELRTPARLSTAEVTEDFAALRCEVALVAAYGLLLPPAMLEAPRFGALNIHASLLPRWRGAAPVERAIMAGDSVTGVSIMQMEAGLDTGPLHLVRQVPIEPGEDGGSLRGRLAALGAVAARDVIGTLGRAGQAPQPQSENGICHAARLEKAERRIDWRCSMTEIFNQIRAFAPDPGAWCRIAVRGRLENVKILEAEPRSSSGAPGVITGPDLEVACGTGALALTRLQRAGRQPVTAGAFQNGARIKIGDRLQ